MKICGCQDAEKGYVIINPDSPDRREILSLNPPICREMIGNSLEVDGEIYIFKKEIQDWEVTPLAGGIKVDWGNGDIEIISGTSWDSIYTLEATGNFSQSMSSSFNPPSCKGTCKSGYWKIRFISNSLSPIVLIQGNSFANSCGRHYYYSWMQDGSPVNSFDWLKYTPCDTRVDDPNGWGLNGNITTQAYYVLTFSRLKIYKIKVISNTDQFSERMTEIEPFISLLEENCGMQVNFTDGTNSGIIEFPQCPQNIKKIESLEISDTGGILEQIAPAPSGEIVISCGERECPPETCFNCDCSELNCCYDENGKLIDSFIRRT